jgi:hypothetical protein
VDAAEQANWNNPGQNVVDSPQAFFLNNYPPIPQVNIEFHQVRNVDNLDMQH